MQADERESAAKELTMPVPKAGKIFYGLGRSASYAAAKRGEIPTIKIGRKSLASVPAIMRQLVEA